MEPGFEEMKPGKAGMKMEGALSSLSNSSSIGWLWFRGRGRARGRRQAKEDSWEQWRG